MKTFAVYSKDKALLKAFEQKLIESGYDGYKEWNDTNRDDPKRCYISISGKYGYYNHDGNAEVVYNLPEGWNEAVEELRIFKPGKWVKINNLKSDNLTDEYKGRVGKIVSPDDVPRPSVHTVDIGSIHINVDEKEMTLATHDEIKDELIGRSGLNIGDRVKIPNRNEFKITHFKLVTNEKDGDQSEYVNDYFEEKGMHLAAGDSYRSCPVGLCVKVDESIAIETDDGPKHVEYTGSHFKVGCEEISLGFLTNLGAVASSCKLKDYSITIGATGSIISFSTPNGRMKKSITIETLRKILKKADQ